MKKTILIIIAILMAAGQIQAQQRDRRVDLNIPCGYRIDLSTTGRLWIADRCGDIYTADSMGATWRTVTKNEDELHISGGTFERVAAFGDDVAVAAGYMHREGYVLRTTTAGALWDSVQVDSNLIWVHGFCYHADGRLWMVAASGRSFKCMAYSTDRGRTFSTLMPPFVDMNDGEGGIHELYMVTADSGFAGTYGGKIYSTSDNWRTAHSLTTPVDQGLLVKKTYMDAEVRRIRPWRGWLIATLFQSTVITPTYGDSLHWQLLPWDSYEVDTVSGNLWAITDSGQLLYLTDMEHRKVLAEGLSFPFDYFIGTLGGCAYLRTSAGVVRISPDGKADTCGFFTEEKTIDEMFDEIVAQYGRYGMLRFPTLSHGGRLWRHDGRSIYLQDALGWYRIAKPLGISEMHPDPDHEDRIIILRGDGKNYSVDTAGRIEPYVYRQPLARFLESGLKEMTINTYNGGCFHYEGHAIAYKRKGDLLCESKNNVDSLPHTKRSMPVATIEQALLRMGETYSLFPSSADFGMEEGEVDLQKVFDETGGCTSYSGYEITFVNRAGDTLTAYGRSDIDCGGYFPWLLPMIFKAKGVDFVTYQPLLWQTLKPLVPEGMMLYDKLNNHSLFDLRAGDLLFFSDEGGMNDAVRESTGQYTHVALVESVDDTVWIIDATQRYGVSHRPFLRTRNGEKPYPDVYRVKRGCYNLDSVLARARSFIGQPYDNAFLPDNGAIYCSELIYEVFLDDCSAKGQHLFKAQPMNWRDKNGKLPEYWKKHFKELGIPVPEGVPGTNPTDMSRSTLLQKQ